MSAAPRTGSAEAFKPIAIKPPSENRAAFAVRCAVDLQLLTVARFIRPLLAGFRGRVLDVGAGEAPWREWVTGAQYVGLDVESADDFGMKRQADVVYYDGGRFPFADDSFDHVMSVEVMEHVPDPAQFLAEVTRVLRSGGSLVLTVPWSARLHHLPHDYHRFTRFALARLLQSAGYTKIHVEARGNDIAVIANKLIVLAIRLLRPTRRLWVVFGWPLSLLVLPVATGFLAAAHVAIRCGWGGVEDPLGYGVVAVKAGSTPAGAEAAPVAAPSAPGR